MIVVGHQLKRKELDLIDLQTFVEDSFKRFEVSIFVKDGCSQVAASQSVVQSPSFINAWWSWHRLSSSNPSRENRILHHPKTQAKRPDPFEFPLAEANWVQYNTTPSSEPMYPVN